MMTTYFVETVTALFSAICRVLFREDTSRPKRIWPGVSGDRETHPLVIRKATCYPLMLLLLSLCFVRTSVVCVTERSDTEPPYQVWEERSLFQRITNRPGFAQFITDLDGVLIQHGPLKHGKAHGDWKAYTVALLGDEKSWTIKYKDGYYKPYQFVDVRDTSTRKNPHAIEEFRPLPYPHTSTPLAISYAPHIREFRGGWRNPLV